MENYKKVETEVTEKSENCINCCHCYIPNDFLLGFNLPELYCNVNKNKPISGDIMDEPFNYYDTDIFLAQEEKWEEWGTQYKVDHNGICDLFKVSK